MNRLILKVILFAFLLISTVANYPQETKKAILFVGTTNNAPFSFTLPDGKATGFYVEFWQLWSKTTGTPIEIRPMDFNSSLEMTKNGQALHLGLFKNDKRKQWANFSLPFHRVETGVLYNYKLAGNTSLGESKALKVSVQSNTFQANYLDKNFSFLNLSYYQEINVGFERLLSNQVDAIIAEKPSLQAQLQRRGLEGVYNLSPETLITNTVHATGTKDQTQIFSIINQGISIIPTEQLIQLEKKWLPNLTTFFGRNVTVGALTLAEKNWLQSNRSFSLGVESLWQPVEFLDKNGKLNGITADYMNYLFKELQINYKPAAEYSWSEAFEALKVGNIDMMSGVVKNKNRAQYMLFTDPYFEVHTVIVTRKNSFTVGSLDDLQSKKMAVVRGYIIYDSIKKDYPSANITQVNSVLDGLLLLNEGKVDAYIGTLPVILYEKNKHQLDNLFVAGYVPYKYQLSIAVRKGLEPLVNILSKTLAQMDTGQRSAIENKWLSVHVERGINLKVFLIWTLPIVLTLVIIFLFIMRMNTRLKHEIAIRAKSETDREFLIEQLHQSQKMEAMGKLTGGIAHDFNNMLGIILGYTSLLKNKLPADDSLSKYVDEIHRAGSRGAKLTSKLLSYTRKQSLEATRLNLNDTLTEQSSMLKKMLTVRIRLTLELDKDLWPVWIDETEFADSLLNLSINAMHAMEKRPSEAELIITSHNLKLSNELAAEMELTDGDYVQISVKDNGCGMDKSVVDRIFEPFFTTKENEGTGLGLSQVYGFMQRSSGALRVESTPNIGTQFQLIFPRFEGMLIEQNDNQVKHEILKGNESILIVDDEQSLRDLADELLSKQGYQTYVAEDGNAALEILQVQPIDLVISDVIVPKMNGYQLASSIQQLYPMIKIQLVSGFTDKSPDSSSNKALSENLLHKPYEPESLYRCIRELLDT